jgi:hypothetical protein
VLSNGHAGCGGRARETGRSKYRYRALARPYPTKSSLAWLRAGRPTVREAETFGGIGMSNKRMPVGESRQETGSMLWVTPPSSQLPDNWPDTGRVWSGPERALTWTGEPVKTNSQTRRNRRTS